MPEALLVLNAGSSSLKFAAFTLRDLSLLVRGQIGGLAGDPEFCATDADGTVLGRKTWPRGSALSHRDAAEFLLSWGRSGAIADRPIVAAGHRVVHGGLKHAGPVLIEPCVRAELQALIPLAPLHQPHSLAVIDAVAELAPYIPQVACFDTAFHRRQPAVAQEFAIPRTYTDRGVRRYGFHGLSYEYIADVLPELDPAAAAGRTIIAHLGSGASMCAVQGGRGIATTMGFTALDGLVMGTRCGSIDPGVIFYLARHAGMSLDEIERMLYEESGLLGVSGISGDMRALLASPDPRARQAVDLFAYRAAREIGSLAAALGGLDAIVFTGGIGENAAAIRAAICRASAWLGVELDEAANNRHGPLITRPGSTVRSWVIPTNEELMIARHTATILSARPTSAQ